MKKTALFSAKCVNNKTLIRNEHTKDPLTWTWTLRIEPYNVKDQEYKPSYEMNFGLFSEAMRAFDEVGK